MSASDEDAIRNVLARYCQTCDDGRFDEFAQVFTEDGDFVVMGQTQHGRNAIEAFMAAAMPPETRGKHLTSNVLIEVAADRASAEVRTDYVFVGRVGKGLGITSGGRYVDRFARGGDGDWRIARREIVFLFDQPMMPG